MNREEYDKEYKRLGDHIQIYNSKRIEVEREYTNLLHIDNRWINAIDAMKQLQLELDALKGRWYDDNMVYTTGERQLSTRYDCLIMRT